MLKPNLSRLGLALAGSAWMVAFPTTVRAQELTPTARSAVTDTIRQ